LCFLNTAYSPLAFVPIVAGLFVDLANQLFFFAESAFALPVDLIEEFDFSLDGRTFFVFPLS
jgi:hypothetical protein